MPTANYQFDGVRHGTVTYQLMTVRYWLTVVTTGTGNQGLIPENRPERWPICLLTAAGAKTRRCPKGRAGKDPCADGAITSFSSRS